MITLIFYTLTLFSCSNAIDISSCKKKIDIEENELQKYVKDGYIDYRVARFFALQELDNHLFNSNNLTLSEIPLIIFDSKALTPKYYEFQVISNSKIIGAISCVAKKEYGDPVKYILFDNKNGVIDIGRNASNNGMNLVDYGYPAKRFFLNKQARLVEASTSKVYDENYSECSTREVLENLNDNELTRYGINPAIWRKETIELIKKEENRLEELWEKIEIASNEIIRLQTNYNNSTSRSVVSSICFSVYEKKLYNWLEFENCNQIGGYCGPNCLMFILLGLGADSNCNFYPKSFDLNDLCTFYYEIENKLGKGPKSFAALNHCLEKISNYKIIQNQSPDWMLTKIAMDKNNLPGLILRSSKSIDKLAWHYRVIVGYRQEKYSLKNQFLWWTWDSLSNDNYYLLHDNGADSGEYYFYEKSNLLYQIGSAYVEKK